MTNSTRGLTPQLIDGMNWTAYTEYVLLKEAGATFAEFSVFQRKHNLTDKQLAQMLFVFSRSVDEETNRRLFKKWAVREFSSRDARLALLHKFESLEAETDFN